MDGFLVSTAALSLAGIVTIAFAAGFLNEARDEFQGRLRNRALKRAHVLLTAALCTWGGAATVAAYGAADLLLVRPSPSTAGLHTVPDAPRVGRQLKPSTTLDASRLGPAFSADEPSLGLGTHVRKKQHVADRG